MQNILKSRFYFEEMLIKKPVSINEKVKSFNYQNSSESGRRRFAN